MFLLHINKHTQKNVILPLAMKSEAQIWWEKFFEAIENRPYR